MVSFIIIIALIIIAFSLIFLVFNREAGYGDYLYQAYNVMYGPMDIEEDAAWPFSQKLIMAVLAFFLNVVLLNLLISIMGDSYGQVLEVRDRTDALTRLEMISEAVIYKKFFKPNHKTARGHLVYCLPVELEEEDDQNQELENNIIKAMRKTIQENNEESKQEILFLKEKILSSEKNSEVMKNEILSLKTNNEAIKASNEEMKTEISNLKEIILSEFSKLKPSILIKVLRRN